MLPTSSRTELTRCPQVIPVTVTVTALMRFLSSPEAFLRTLPSYYAPLGYSNARAMFLGSHTVRRVPYTGRIAGQSTSRRRSATDDDAHPTFGEEPRSPLHGAMPRAMRRGGNLPTHGRGRRRTYTRPRPCYLMAIRGIVIEDHGARAYAEAKRRTRRAGVPLASQQRASDLAKSITTPTGLSFGDEHRRVAARDCDLWSTHHLRRSVGLVVLKAHR